jgi:dihydroflavonol-4-reductase
MKIFLTGGTGFIGQPLAQALLKRGWQVTALVRQPDSPQAQALVKMGANCLPGDVTDRESMRASMTAADIVIHNAAWYEFGLAKKQHQLMHDINVTGTANILSLALELGIPRTVYVSSTIAFGPTGKTAVDETYKRQKPFSSYYEQTKTEAHEIAHDFQRRGLPLIIVCPDGVVGPNDHSARAYFLRMYLNHLMPPFAWSPDTINSLVHVTDLSNGIALAAEKGKLGETYILAGEPLSSREMVGIWMTKPGGFKVRFYIPTWLAQFMFAPLEPLQRLIGLPAAISRETASAASISMAYSSLKAQRELGWTFRPAKEMWLETIDQELVLRAKRQKRNLVSRLKPLGTS